MLWFSVVVSGRVFGYFYWGLEVWGSFYFSVRVPSNGVCQGLGYLHHDEDYEV